MDNSSQGLYGVDLILNCVQVLCTNDVMNVRNDRKIKTYLFLSGSCGILMAELWSPNKGDLCGGVDAAGGYAKS